MSGSMLSILSKSIISRDVSKSLLSIFILSSNLLELSSIILLFLLSSTSINSAFILDIFVVSFPSETVCCLSIIVLVSPFFSVLVSLSFSSSCFILSDGKSFLSSSISAEIFNNSSLLSFVSSLTLLSCLFTLFFF